MVKNLPKERAEREGEGKGKKGVLLPKQRSQQSQAWQGSVPGASHEFWEGHNKVNRDLEN